MILYNDTTALLTPGWGGVSSGAGGSDTITEISTDAYEGSRCLDFKFTVIQSGEMYAFAVIKMNNMAGFDMTPYDSLKFAYKQVNTALTPQVEFAWCDNSLPPDAEDYSIPKTTAWKLCSVPLSHWKSQSYGSKMSCVSCLYLKAVGAAGRGDFLIDNVSLVAAGSSSVKNQAAPVETQKILVK